MELEESTCLTSDYTTQPQSSRQCGIGTNLFLIENSKSDNFMFKMNPGTERFIHMRKCL